MNTWKIILTKMILVKAHCSMKIIFLKLDRIHSFLFK